jgi:nucleotide-binding universal stress UspA family protein
VIDFLLAEAAASNYDEGKLKEDAASELAAFVASEHAGGAQTMEMEVLVETGRVDRVILSSAIKHRAALIAMGTQGLGRLRKALFGSVTEKVLREVAIPVLAVTRGASGDTSTTLTGVVAAIDFDAAAAHVARHAAALAAELDVPLTLVHVVARLTALPQYTNALAAAEEARQREARVKLQAEAARIGSVVKTELRVGAVAEEIAVLLRHDPGCIVVIGTGGGRPLHRPGSTAYRVLSLSSVPVLAVPPELSMT